MGSILGRKIWVLLLAAFMLVSLYSSHAFANAEVGAYFGTNNTDISVNTGYKPSNGTGGTVSRIGSSSTTALTNSYNSTTGTDTFTSVGNYNTTSYGSKTFRVTPNSGFRIKYIRWGVSSCTFTSGNCSNTPTAPASWTSVSITSPDTSYTEFDQSVSTGNVYLIWAVFEATTSSNRTVTGTVAVDTNTPPCSTDSSVSPASEIVANNDTQVFTITPGSGCVIDCITDPTVGGGCVAKPASTTTYTTGAINSDINVSFLFKPITYNITVTNLASSPTGSGTITPPGVLPGATGTVVVRKNTNQTFAITPNTGFRVLDVSVTQNGVTTDLGPNITTYAFNNVVADGSITVQFASNAATIDSYCQVPAFVSGQATLLPNVLIIFDNSGSMGGTDTDGLAYKGRKSPCDATTTSYLANCDYYGYFDITKMYTYSSNTYSISTAGFSRTKKTSAVGSTSSSAWSGNQLNYEYMHKVDVIRKILVGGKIDASVKGVARTATGTKYLIMDYKTSGTFDAVEYGPDQPTGMVQLLKDKVRFGLEVFGSTSSSTGDGGTIVSKLGDPTATLVTAIEQRTEPLTSTPIAEALYEAVRYFEAKPSAYNSSTDYGDTTWNPTTSPIIQYPCQKHFVLLLTDGEANSTDKLPGLTNPTLNSYTDTSVDFKTTWLPRITAADKPTSSDGQYVDAVSFYAHNTDLRNATLNNEILGTQNLTIYTVYAFGDGTGTKTLQSAAKYGAYDNTNLNGSLAYPSPDLTAEWDKDGDGKPDTYFEADDGSVLEANIMKAMSSILAKVSSGTAASILSNSEGSGANMLQAVFYPSKIFEENTQVDWTGEMQNLWYYIDPFIDASTVREDTDFVAPASNPTTPDHVLDLRKDNVVRFYFDADKGTQVELKQDVNGDGVGDVLVNSGDPDIVKSIWRAGKLLWARTPSTRNILTSLTGTSLLANKFTTTNKTALKPYLQAADDTESDKIIAYIRGTDQTGYRNRLASFKNSDGTFTQNEWKLGDIISSTPRLQSTTKQNYYSLATPVGYDDVSYARFVSSSSYKSRGMVYSGANDGMLHAFKLGKLTVAGNAVLDNGTALSISGNVKATLTGTSLGEEQWAYIPRNALPYLKYFTDKENYKHIFYVDGVTTLADVSTGKPSACSASSYVDCPKDLANGTNWKSVLIGSMGLGGASYPKASTCTDGASGTCVRTPILDPADDTKSLGYSSYFALDVTNQYFNSSNALAGDPTLLWELTHPDLGYSTSGAAIVRVKTTVDGTSSTSVDGSKNGKWFAVFASGPTGSIDTVAHQFKGKSDHNLKIFVVDLGASGTLTQGTNYWVLDTGIQRAFGGNISNGVIDSDRWNKAADGNYQDDAIYVGYTKANIADASAIDGNTLWTTGGVIRILTKESLDPTTWVINKVIDGIGPVTSGIAKLQDRKNKKLWLYFGTGRYYYSGDDVNTSRGRILGIQDLCYNTTNALDKACTTTMAPVLGLSDLVDQTSSISASLGTSKGWYINLDAEDSSNSLSAERNITDPVALTNGAVFYTTFKPTSDVCKFGGSSYIWGVKYDTGGTAPAAALTGKALVQVSTGSFEEVALKTALTASNNRKMGSPMTGKPPTDAPPIVSNASNKPAKKILHIQER